MTAVAANGLPTLRATPLFNTPIKGMPAPAKRDHAAKIKYERIWGCSDWPDGMALLYSTVRHKPERSQTSRRQIQTRPLRVVPNPTRRQGHSTRCPLRV